MKPDSTNRHSGAGMTPEEAQYRARILQRNAQFYAAFRGRDMAAMSDVWAKTGPVGVRHPGMPHLNGRSAVLQSWLHILGNPPDISFAVEGMLDEEDACAVMCVEQIGQLRLRMVNLFRLEGSSWKLSYHGPTPRIRLRR